MDLPVALKHLPQQHQVLAEHFLEAFLRVSFALLLRADHRADLAKFAFQGSYSRVLLLSPLLKQLLISSGLSQLLPGFCQFLG